MLVLNLTYLHLNQFRPSVIHPRRRNHTRPIFDLWIWCHHRWKMKKAQLPLIELTSLSPFLLCLPTLFSLLPFLNWRSTVLDTISFVPIASDQEDHQCDPSNQIFCFWTFSTPQGCSTPPPHNELRLWQKTVPHLTLTPIDILCYPLSIHWGAQNSTLCEPYSIQSAVSFPPVGEWTPWEPIFLGEHLPFLDIDQWSWSSEPIFVHLVK